ncbi:MAG TPA: hypothetical protein VFD70_11795 [Anaerolineae bacterium]|nr:hypothetical protein [Anaerolineae bacterium]
MKSPAQVGRKTGTTIGFGASTPDALTKLLERGFTWIVYGPDYFLLRAAIGAGITRFRELTAAQ